MDWNGETAPASSPERHLNPILLSLNIFSKALGFCIGCILEANMGEF
jgi:hypothetical protein